MSSGRADQDLRRRQERELFDIVMRSPLLRPVLDRWEEISLPDCWLAAGAVAQTVWNSKLGKPHDYGLRDIDLVYFDDTNLTREGEDAEAERLRGLFPDMPVNLDVKNEARVHLWYAERFGKTIAPYQSCKDAIKTFPTTATAFGVRCADGQFQVFAPYGLSDVLGLRIVANKKQITEEVYLAKTSRWRELWPELEIVDW